MMLSSAAALIPRYTTGAVRIAYQVIGTGASTLVVLPGLASHLTFDWQTPETRTYYQRLATGRRLIRYDKRGTGLSDRPLGEAYYSREAFMGDLEAVLDAAGVGRVALLGWSEGGSLAIAFAVAHPERVERLVLYGAYAKRYAAPGYPIGGDQARGEAVLQLVRSEWGLGSRVLADIFVPEADAQRAAWFTAYQREATSPQVAAELLRSAYRADVRELLPRVAAPALVLHRRHDRAVPFALGLYLAQHLPHVTFRELEGEHHLPYFGDVNAITDAIDAFFCAGPATDGADPTEPQPHLSPREMEVLRLVAEGYPNRQIADALCLSPATVARHLANIYHKLGVSTRTAAAAHALRHRLV